MRNIAKVLGLMFALVFLPSIAFGQLAWDIDQLIDDDNAVYDGYSPQVAISGNKVR
jgi:uncharacterized membrane protein YccC